MKPDYLLGRAFRRAATFFPTGCIAVECGTATLRPDNFCAVSFDPPMVAITFPGVTTPIAGVTFSISAEGVRLGCTVLEAKEVGDHTILFAAVSSVELQAGEPPQVNWRRGCFRLRLDYPFLESGELLETFVHDWASGVLPKSAWTHAAHVGVTGYHAYDHDPAAVFAEMKRGILHFNTCTGVVNGRDSGYHETLTHFWSDRIASAVRYAGPGSRLEAARSAVRLFGEDRDLPSLFYSFDVVQDRRARAEWVPPDVQPVAEWCGQ
jgi:hypothetical protein